MWSLTRINQAFQSINIGNKPKQSIANVYCEITYLHVAIAMQCGPLYEKRWTPPSQIWGYWMTNIFVRNGLQCINWQMKTLLVVGDRLPEQGGGCICTHVYLQTMSWQQNSEIQVEFLLQQLDHISRSVERQASWGDMRRLKDFHFISSLHV